MRGKTICALAMAGLVAGCGGATAQKDESGAAASAAALVSYHKCSAAWSPFLTKLKALNSRLDVGMVQSDYNTALGDARVAYDAATPHVKGMTSGCLAVGSTLEAAYNAYIDANTYWANCIQQTYCTVSESRLRGSWTTASGDITSAQKLLVGLKSLGGR